MGIVRTVDESPVDYYTCSICHDAIAYMYGMRITTLITDKKELCYRFRKVTNYFCRYRETLNGTMSDCIFCKKCNNFLGYKFSDSKFYIVKKSIY